jgi:hypothetical protein
MYQNLKPDKTLVVVVPQSGFKSNVKNYPDATIITLTHEGLIEEQVRDWWKDLDVVISVETLYDWRIAEWGRSDGVKTIVHGNPEFYVSTKIQPDHWWWPTSWRTDVIPAGPIIPVPVSTPVNRAADPYSGSIRLVHIVGNKAMGDRNGTALVQEGAEHCRFDVEISSYSQAGPVGAPQRLGLTQFYDLKPVEDRWTMYDGQHALILPRRYGGLCLPALEAMSSGLAVIMTDCSPNMDWPIIPLESEPSRHLQMQCGIVETFDARANNVGSIMNHLYINRQILADAQEKAWDWAQENTWEKLAPMYFAQLDKCK